ncbi:MAG: AraC family transcriptional regulator [Eubacteriales bacterium]|nr:AraC family transcriptional regulator [Eubacteriales bacterium]
MAISICGTLTDLHDQELNKHGDPAFPIACYADDLSIKNVPWHWHEEWEFAIVQEGCPNFFLESQHIPIRKGDGIFINGKALHAVSNNSRQPSALHSAVFHPRLIGGNTDSIYWQSLVQPFMTNTATRYLLLHANVDWEMEILEHFSHAWEAVAYDLDDYANIARYELSAGVRKLIAHNDFSATNSSEQELVNAVRIRTMLEFIEEHYSEDLSVDVLANSIMVSPSACLRCFHRMLHTTPMQYVKQLRIKKSADLLRTTNKSAKEIAVSCGFNDISYFTRSFKEIYNQTPGNFRRSIGAEDPHQ